MRVSGNYSSSQDEWSSESYSYTRNANAWNMALDGTWRYGHYFNDDDGLHVVGNTEGSHRIHKTQYELYENDVYMNWRHLSATLEGELGLGIGFGRMRDGTFVFQALRIVERLRESGLAHAELTRGQFLALVNRVARRREYTTNFQRHEKYIVQDIVDDLVETGVLDSSAIIPLAALRVEEGLRERVAVRLFGWRAYATFGARYSRSFNESKEMGVVDYHRVADDGVFLGTIVGEWGQAISMFSHLNASIRFDVPNKAPSTHYRAETMVSMSYEITERIDIITRYSFFRSVSTRSQFRPEENDYGRTLSHSIEGTLRLFIEDMITFDVNAGYVNYRNDSYYRDSQPSSFYRRSGFSGSFRINYNII